MRSPGVAVAIIVLVEARLVEDIAGDEVLRGEVRNQLVGQPDVGMVGRDVDVKATLPGRTSWILRWPNCDLALGGVEEGKLRPW
jgi:hypothetical protein